jgi:cyclophilin family peptidyl-prolyl cis-trans isomerase/uncharacterized protein (DUF2141 family)
MKRLFLIVTAWCLLVAFQAGAVTPAILSQPQSITVNNASAAAFTVVATNAATYQWQFDGTNSLPGETNALLNLDNVTTNQAGSYTVVVTSSDHMSVTSAPPAVLTIVPGTVVQFIISTFPGGASSNVVVQLFDHDKPATVQNFMHYIISGAYSNMFFDRDVPNFVLQGGDYVAEDRSSTNFWGFQITPGTNFPSQVDSEFGVGPLLHNTFGTIAMALAIGKSNSASAAFFFNLTNNTPYLDTNTGGFTVFGRILTGSNVLQYFNTLSAPSNGICDLITNIPTLPVNYDGTNQPENANFLFCDFKFISPTNPVLPTTPPTVSITTPATNSVVVLGSPLVAQGTAQFTNGLAEVFCTLSWADGAFSGSVTNPAVGTANWSLDLSGELETNGLGDYTLTAYAEDGAGNLSAPVTVYFTNLAQLTIITNSDGHLTTNSQYLAPGQQYSVTAAPGPGQVFYDWQFQGGNGSLNPVQSFVGNSNVTLTVTYVSNTLPAGLAITFPTAGSSVQAPGGHLVISGTLPSSGTVTQLTCQLFSQSNAVAPAQAAILNGTNWSLAVSNLVGGPYMILVTADDASGLSELLAENFTALTAPSVITTQPVGLTVNAGSAAVFKVVASNAVAYQWQLAGIGAISGATNATLSLDDLNTNQAGSYTVVVTSPDTETVTSAPAVLTIAQGTVVQVTFSTYPDGSSNSFLVELFNHDKPATVENFIHYITSGMYSNMFLDTDETNFILQGGAYVNHDRTTGTPGLLDHSIYYTYIVGNSNFPAQVASEFNVGPVVSNTFGTLAMTLTTGNPNSAGSGFLFNLADNSATLDAKNGGYTVFGRILTGSNVLQYFNALSAPGNGIIDYSESFTMLPVNYAGTAKASDRNVFYCDFEFQTPPPVDTNAPTVSVAFPAPNTAFDNGSPLTVTGTAFDDVGLADVFCILTSTTGAYGGRSQTNIAAGTTNWSLNLVSKLGPIEPGVYQLTVFAQDGAGNLSAPATEFFTNLARLTIITNVNGQLTTNSPDFLLPAQSYSVTAMPAAGQTFDTWQNGSVVSINPVQTFTLNSNLTFTVTYLSNSLPAGLAITSPAANSTVQSTNTGLTVTGTIPLTTTVTQLTCQLFSQSTAVTAALPAILNGGNWSVAVSNLANGPYTIVATAEDNLGNFGLETENFTLQIAPFIISQPASVTVNSNSAADFSVTAGNAASYQWQFAGMGAIPGATNATLALDDVSTNQAGSYTVVVTAPSGLTVTSAPAVLTVVPGIIVQLTISKFPGGGSNSFLVELFNHDKPATVENFIHYIASGSYSNMFFDRDVPGFVLQGGDYATPDRTTNQLSGQKITPGTNFPPQVDSEFGVGPLIHNTFGTMAMALATGDSNYTSAAFFFNLTNNSPYLDTNNGGFTVFGRILTGSNVLEYFNTLSAPTNGIFDLKDNIPTLPVNYDGTNEPTDASVFYCDFKFISPTNPPVDTTPPTVSIAVPAPNATFPNTNVVTVQGTANDNVGLAWVYCVFTPLTGIYANQSATNAAVGTANWSDSFPIQLGIYQLMAYAQDAAGNLSAPATVYFTNLSQLTVITNANGIFSTNAPQYLAPNEQYSVTAMPGPGEVFYNWQYLDGGTSIDPLQTFTGDSNVTLTVTFVSNSLPAGLAITSPVKDSTVQTTNAGLTITGTLPSSITVTELTCQLFYKSNAVTALLSPAINGADWSLGVSNLAGGLYTLVVVADDSLGQSGLVSENFTALVPPVITTQPASVTVNTSSSASFSVEASAAASYQWQFQSTGNLPGQTNATLELDDVSASQAGSYAVVVTAVDGQSVTSAPAVLTVVPGTIIEFIISTYPDGGTSNLTVQLFDHDKPVTVANFIHYVTSGTYSNMFFDQDEPNSVLIGGNSVTFDRTSDQFLNVSISPGTNFPSQVASEFDVGPLIPNQFGTLGMVASGFTNAAPGAFFFNLTDNSTNFDPGGYTVFGRVVSGSNVLQYFNTLSAPSNGISDNPNNGFEALPVNYNGTNLPADSNVFYCDFKFISPTNPPVDTIPPTLSITNLAPNTVFSNNGALAVRGVANDNVGLAEVFCILTASTGDSVGENVNAPAQGTTNWLFNQSIAPGAYQLTAFAQDGSGNLSAPATVFFTNLAQLTVITNAAGRRSTNAAQFLVPGQVYTLKAVAEPGQVFYAWNTDGQLSLNPVQTFTASDNLTTTAEFISNDLPAGLAITSPASGAQVEGVDSVLTVSGILPSTSTNVQLTCQFFINSNSVSSARSVIPNGTNWSLSVTNLANGVYTVVAVASNTAGQTSLASSAFTLTNVQRLTLNTIGRGTLVGNPGPLVVPGLYTVKAVADAGYVFYSWSDGVTTTLNPTNTFFVSSNLTLTATFVPDDTSLKGVSITYPPANSKLTSVTFNVAGRLPASLVVTQMTCQLFLQSNGVTVLPQPVIVDSTSRNWSLPVTNLTPGSYRILAVAYDSSGAARPVAENFDILAKLSVTAQGGGSVIGEPNGKYLQVGKTYVVGAVPKPGKILAYWTGGVENPTGRVTEFVMSSNTSLTAYFTNNPFTNLTGTYSGVFYDAGNVTPTNAGFAALTLSRSGVVSGKFIFPQHTLDVFSASIDYAGVGVLTSKWVNSNSLIIELFLDLTNGTDTFSGSIEDVSATGKPLWTNELLLIRGVSSLVSSNAPAGKYAILLNPANGTNSSDVNGYAAISIGKNGAIALGGTLPDNTPISASARMSKYGFWPIYVVPPAYKEKGMLIGWETTSTSNLGQGQLYWVKPGASQAVVLNSTNCAQITPPTAGTTYQFVLPGGTTDSLSVNASHQFEAAGSIEAISLLPTGVISGRVEINGGKLPFKGVFISPAQGGGGFIIDSGQTEAFTIEPQP